MGPPREVVVDPERRKGDRLPIVVTDRSGFEFREPAVAVNLDGRPRGVIGWDPVLGWVLVLGPRHEQDR